VNFNYSYKAFLISSLLVGNLILILVSIKLGAEKQPQEETVPIEYIETLPEEVMALNEATSEKADIKTNTAYNEAEQFIKEIEEGRNEITSEENEVSTNDPFSFENTGNVNFEETQKRLEEAKKKLALASSKKPKASQSVNRKTTISYRLVDRKALYLPNPVYTCNSGGKIVISIEVDDRGNVIKKDYNPTLSTTRNGCLIDAALAYAESAQFTTKAGKPKQLGTITYLFPGQE
tara:strand:- start:110103 stop:110804 length:702 start_codon:yes stop_codon:yes gene_type:complete